MIIIITMELCTRDGKIQSLKVSMHFPKISRYKDICDRICEKGSYTRIQFSNFVMP